MKGLKHLLFLGLTLGMLIYAVPRLRIGEGWTLPAVFAVCWIVFALLVVASHLHELMGVDEEERQEWSRLQRYKAWRRQQIMRNKMKGIQSGK